MPIDFKDNAKSKKLQRKAILEVPLSSQNDVRDMPPSIDSLSR